MNDLRGFVVKFCGQFVPANRLGTDCRAYLEGTN